MNASHLAATHDSGAQKAFSSVVFRQHRRWKAFLPLIQLFCGPSETWTTIPIADAYYSSSSFVGHNFHLKCGFLLVPNDSAHCDTRHWLSIEFEGNVPSRILDTQFNGGEEVLWMHLLPHSKYGKYRL